MDRLDAIKEIAQRIAADQPGDVPALISYGVYLLGVEEVHPITYYEWISADDIVFAPSDVMSADPIREAARERRSEVARRFRAEIQGLLA